MKRVLMGLALAITVSCSTGCELLQRNKGCNSCNGNVGCRPCKLGWQRGGTDYQRFLGQNGSYCNAQPAGHTGAGGPATAQVAYPYYTTRGPRDFFMNNPPTIGR
ncbi:MAG: hypothetical protein ACE361_19090 [Aureliella sp.]